VPIDLDMNRTRPAERGLPMLPSAEMAREIAGDMARMSEIYGTKMQYNESDRTISVMTG
jgi:poly-gamma-glutamate synthesis protein (capsule biosynthesis protein)